MANWTKGIDVSTFQGDIDYKKAKADGVDFVIPRCGFGFSTVDDKFYRNVREALAAGVAVPAIYHFSYALTKADAAQEAQFACQLAKDAGLPGTTIIFYDLEYDNVDRYAKDGKNNHAGKSITIGKVKASEMAKAFCDKVKELGFVPGIYANTDYLGRMFSASVIDNHILWHADYRTDAKPDSRATFFQFTSKGKVDGIYGNVDVNEYLGKEAIAPSKPEEKPAPKKTNEELAEEVIQGKWGNGDDRKKKLTEAGYNYIAVQKIVNERMKAATPALKPIADIAHEVIAGKWGNGDDRKKKLEAAGYKYQEVQNKVNELLKNNANAPITVNGKKVSPAMSRDDSLAGTYTVNVDALNMRYQPNKLTADNVIRVLKRGEKVQNYGYYNAYGNSKWLLIQVGNVTGWVAMGYLKR